MISFYILLHTRFSRPMPYIHDSTITYGNMLIFIVLCPTTLTPTLISILYNCFYQESYRILSIIPIHSKREMSREIVIDPHNMI